MSNKMIWINVVMFANIVLTMFTVAKSDSLFAREFVVAMCAICWRLGGLIEGIESGRRRK